MACSTNPNFPPPGNQPGVHAPRDRTQEPRGVDRGRVHRWPGRVCIGPETRPDHILGSPIILFSFPAGHGPWAILPARIPSSSCSSDQTVSSVPPRTERKATRTGGPQPSSPAGPAMLTLPPATAPATPPAGAACLDLHYARRSRKLGRWPARQSPHLCSASTHEP